MVRVLTLSLLFASILCGLDREREGALADVLAGFESNREMQLSSPFAREKPALRDKINALHDQIIADFKRDVSQGKITPGSRVAKKMESYESSLKSMIEKGKEKAAKDLRSKIQYLKWLTGDESIPNMPEKAIIY